MAGITALAKREERDGKAYFQTLRGHTYDALRILKAYFETQMDILEEFCRSWELQKELFLRNIFITVYLHDIGKLTEQFQTNIRKGKRSSNYPHAYFFLHFFDDFPGEKILEEVSIEHLAVLGHHTELYNGLYGTDENIGFPRFFEEEVREFIEGISDAYHSLGFSSFFHLAPIDIPEIKRYNSTRMRRKRNELIRRSSEGNIDEKIKRKAVFSYFFSLLQTCDDYSSANFYEIVMNGLTGKKEIMDSVLTDPIRYVPRLHIEDPFKVALKDKTPYSFQEEIYNTMESAFLFAPCGRGKTEAALLWAIRMLDFYHRNRIVFAMPTQTTSNAMYDRFSGMFGEDKVGLFHGTSFIKLKSEAGEKKGNEGLDEKDTKEIQSETFKGKIFFNPITVTTVDHLLLSFVHGFSQADFALGNLMNSVIVFDEVHYYEKFTLEHIVTLLKFLDRMNIPYLLMSGTLPEFLIDRIKAGDKDRYPVIMDRVGLGFTPFRIEKKEEILSLHENPELLKEIEENFRNGLTQFFIFNTVNRAKSFYRELISQNVVECQQVILYHSQFIFKDRVRKEKDIVEMYLKSKDGKNPFILIATQVIEISLDISCDIMYTELAPPDALGQRGGRLNRGGRIWEKGKTSHALKIYIPPNEKPYASALMEGCKQHIEKYLGPVSYMDIKAFCDSVYNNYKLATTTNLLDFFKEGVLFGPSYKELRYSEEEGRIFKTRSEEFQKIEVIPNTIYESLGEDALRREYMVQIPLYIFQWEVRSYGEPLHFYSVVKEKGRRKKTYIIATFPYSFKLGFDFNDKPISAEMI